MKNFFLCAAVAVALTSPVVAQNDSTYVNGRGDTVQRQGNVQNGAGTVNKTYTGPNGNTATVNKSINGNTVDKTITGPNGGTSTVDKTYNGNTVDKTVTGPKGNTYSANSTYGKNTVTKTQTGPKGNTRTVTRARAHVR